MWWINLIVTVNCWAFGHDWVYPFAEFRIDGNWERRKLCTHCGRVKVLR